jgi:hypothetical protein
MELRFHCPHCDLPMRISRWETLEAFHCPACKRPIPIYARDENKKELILEHCLLCNGDKLFVQKAFNRNLGLGIVGVGVILSFWTYGLSLLAVALIDLYLYYSLKPMAVCYACDAEFRGFHNASRFKLYNHLKAAHVKKQATYPGAEEAAHD